MDLQNSGAFSPIVGDFNEDGLLDLAVIGGVNSIYVALNTGGGTFSTPTPYS